MMNECGLRHNEAGSLGVGGEEATGSRWLGWDGVGRGDAVEGWMGRKKKSAGNCTKNAVGGVLWGESTGRWLRRHPKTLKPYEPEDVSLYRDLDDAARLDAVRAAQCDAAAAERATAA